MFLGLPDPDPALLVRGMDPAPDSSHQAKQQENLDFYCFVTSFRLLSLKNYLNVPSESNKQKNFLF